MLDSKIKVDLQASYRKLQAKGKLFTPDQLAQFYATFRDRFGPERLASLDGEALLDLMHLTQNVDSLVYWLEYKHDEEFPAYFGSISGGSAFKFGIFRRKRTGAWETTDDGNNPLVISVSEAIVIARRNRDQLLRGVELIRQVPLRGTDEDYARLQQQLDEQAPDVSRMSWGHKYFCLICPERVGN